MTSPTAPTAADYGWIRSPSSLFAYALEVGYTLTLVRGVSPVELLEMVEAEPLGVCQGLGELIEGHGEFTETYDDSFLAGACIVPGEGGDWTLALDFGGDLGIRPRLMEALSAGTRAVSHSSNSGKPMDFFHWYENGELRTTFEWPAHRTGSTPDELNSVMSEVGLDPTSDGDPSVDRKAAVFALAERLTGVQVTEELLRGAEYRMGEVPEEPAEEWRSITIDLRDAHGEGLYVQVDRDQL
jgi:hypothetical protein